MIELDIVKGELVNFGWESSNTFNNISWAALLAQLMAK